MPTVSGFIRVFLQRSTVLAPAYGPTKRKATWSTLDTLRGGGSEGEKSERVEPSDPADPGAKRMDKAVLGGGEARRPRTAALPELRAFPAPALSDLYPVRLDRPEIRAGARFGDDQRLHDHVPHRRQALCLGRPLRQHNCRTR